MIKITAIENLATSLFSYFFFGFFIKLKNYNIMKIERMKSYQVQGFNPEIKLMDKVNELIDEVNRLNKKIKKIESKP